MSKTNKKTDEKNSIFGDSHIPSRKIISDVIKNLQSIRMGIFDESTIKLLLMEVREIAGDAKTIIRKNGKNTDQARNYIEEYKFVIDIANCIAHPTRESNNLYMGVIEQTIDHHLSKIYTKFNKPSSSEFSSVSLEALQSRDLIKPFLSIFMLLLNSIPQNEAKTFHFLDGIEKHFDDVILCILSLLQDTFFKLKRKDHFANLFLTQHNDRYVIKCCVFHTSSNEVGFDYYPEFLLIDSDLVVNIKLPTTYVMHSRFNSGGIYDCRRSEDGKLILVPCNLLLQPFL